jgi:hypothetical protein
MMGIAVDLEIAGTHADDRAADTSGLGIPAHAIMDLEALGHGRRSDATEKLKSSSSRTAYLSGMGIPTVSLSVGSAKSRHFADNLRS